MLVEVQPLLEPFGDWPAFLASGLSEAETAELRAHERTGRPLGSPAFVDGRRFRPQVWRSVLPAWRRVPHWTKEAPSTCIRVYDCL